MHPAHMSAPNCWPARGIQRVYARGLQWRLYPSPVRFVLWVWWFGSVQFSSVRCGSVRVCSSVPTTLETRRVLLHVADFAPLPGVVIFAIPLWYSTATAPTRRHATCQALWTWANLLCRVVCSLEIRYAIRSEFFFQKLQGNLYSV